MITRYRLCKYCGDLHALDAWPDNHRDLPPARAVNVAIPSFIRDDMGDLLHPCDNGVYSSKSEFRRVTKAHGGLELGNDEPKNSAYIDTTFKDDVTEAYRMVVSEGYKPDLAKADSEVNVIG